MDQVGSEGGQAPVRPVHQHHLTPIWDIKLENVVLSLMHVVAYMLKQFQLKTVLSAKPLFVKDWLAKN
jgi:hypothetical protein